MKLLNKKAIPFSLPGDREMKLHPINLTFQDELACLEDDFRKSMYENEKYMLEIRIVIFLTFLFFSAFGILDILLVPDNYVPLFIIRYAVFCPFACIVMGFTYTRYFGKNMQLVFMALALVGGGGIVAMIVVTPPPVTYSYYTGLILIFMFIYCFGRVRFIWATITCWLLTLMYEISAIYLVDTPLPVFVNNNFFFISANVIGMVSCYMFEYFERRNFFINIELRKEREKTREINEDLERRVQERTSLLNSINEDLKMEIEERKRIEGELKQIHGELEIRVETRTFDLMNANRELERARDAANASARAKSEFLANMSHEIRTPMNAIIGMADLSMNAGIDSNQRQEYLRIIRSSARSLLGIINDILDLSKIEAGKLELEETPFRVREYIEGVADLFIETVSMKQIELVVDIADDVPFRVVGDPLRLQQVLLNLISNAVKFTEKGEVCLRVRTGAFTATTVELVCEVRDTGIGIRLEEGKDLFEAFAQADGSVTRKYGGTGLGLAICKHIVSMMNGSIHVNSEPGKGSTFTFTIVMKRDPGVGPFPEKTVHSEETSRIAVLAVISNPTLKIATTRMISSFGFTIDIVDSIEAATSVLTGPESVKAYDVILVDASNNESVASFLTAVSESPLPVVAFGNLKSDHDINRLKEQGVTTYIVKPLKPSVLYRTLLKTVEGGETVHSVNMDPRPERTQFEGMKILLVEDNPINQIVATELLNLAGIEVSKAVNGREAIAMVEQFHFDAVLMDIQMPEMDGIEATRYIRNTLGKPDIPIIAMSAHVMKTDQEKCLKAGMNDFIPKPVDRKHLFRVLSHYYLTDTPSTKAVQAKPESPAVQSFPGLDVRDALKRLNLSYGIYCQIIREFVDCYQSIPDQLTLLAEKQNYNELANTAHSLKGSSANISANDLNRAARELEERVKSGDHDGIHQCIKRIESALKEVTRSLDMMLRTSENDSTA